MIHALAAFQLSTLVRKLTTCLLSCQTQGSSEKVSAPWAVAGSPGEARWLSSQPELEA